MHIASLRDFCHKLIDAAYERKNSRPRLVGRAGTHSREQLAGRYVIHGRKVAYSPVKEPLVDEPLDEAFEMHDCERDGTGTSAFRGIAGSDA